MTKLSKSLPCVALAGMLLLGACASSETPYAPRQEGSGYGFSEQSIESNRYRVTFRGNSQTSRETVENYLLYRAAELTLQKGYDYFVVVEDDTEKTTTYRGTSVGRDPFSYYGRGRAFPYYGSGYRFGGGYDDFSIRESRRYTAIAYILMYKGQKSTDRAAYGAQSVQDNLRSFILRAEG